MGNEEQVAELRRDLGKVFDRLTSIETKLSERCESRGETLEKLKEEVDRLKINQAKVIGAATLLSVVIGYVLKGLGLE